MPPKDMGGPFASWGATGHRCHTPPPVVWGPVRGWRIPAPASSPHHPRGSGLPPFPIGTRDSACDPRGPFSRASLTHPWRVSDVPVDWGGEAGR
ncbi:unnamed protein product [Lasius platythorax]|uniref:Uncharacterized protein n=1 Tax=Lasius platythorax TaxID=488582 RepID=A0AAV2NLQ1_9HYME